MAVCVVGWEGGVVVVGWAGGGGVGVGSWDPEAPQKLLKSHLMRPIHGNL